MNIMTMAIQNDVGETKYMFQIPRRRFKTGQILENIERLDGKYVVTHVDSVAVCAQPFIEKEV